MNEDQKNIGIFFLVVLVIFALKFEQQLARIFLDEDIKSVMAIHKKYPKNETSVLDFKSFFSVKTTDIQRNEFIQNNKYKIVQWTGKVKNVNKIRDYYVITLANEFVPKGDVSRLISDGIRIATGGSIKDRIDSVCGKLYLYPTSPDNDIEISKFSVGKNFRYEAVIDDVDNSGCITAKYGILSKDQSRLSDSGYRSELMTSVFQIAQDAKEMIADIDNDSKNVIGNTSDSKKWKFILQKFIDNVKGDCGNVLSLKKFELDEMRVYVDPQNFSVIHVSRGNHQSDIYVYDLKNLYVMGFNSLDEKNNFAHRITGDEERSLNDLVGWNSCRITNSEVSLPGWFKCSRASNEYKCNWLIN